MKLLTTLKPLILSFILVGGLSYIYAWTGPTQAPTGGNTPTPINVGTSTQSVQNKAGTLGVDTLVAFNKVAANQYCDINGSNCITTTSVGGGIPAGAVMAFNLSACPSGWAEANGSNSTPDLRGRFIRGWNHGSGNDPDAATRTGGDTVGSYQADELKSHSHLYSYFNIWFGGHDAGGDGSGVNDWDWSYSNANTTNTGGNETRPRNIALIYCQKL